MKASDILFFSPVLLTQSHARSQIKPTCDTAGIQAALHAAFPETLHLTRPNLQSGDVVQISRHRIKNECRQTNKQGHSAL